MHCFKFGIAAATAFLIGLIMFPMPSVLAQEITLTVGQQKSIATPDLVRIAVGNPRVADVQAIDNNKQVLITANGDGTTNLIIWKKDGTQESMTIRVQSQNPEEVAAHVRDLLKGVEGVNVRILGNRVIIDGHAFREADMGKVTKVTQLFPQAVSFVELNPAVLGIIVSRINDEFAREGLVAVRATRVGDQIMLDGDVPSEQDKQKAEMMAQAFGTDISNFIRVGISMEKMVVVEVDFVEISKKTMRELGVRWDDGIRVEATSGARGGIGSGGGALTGQYNLASPGGSGIGIAYGATIQAIQGDTNARFLARPRLVCRSGESANFLAGGEVPIKVVTANTSDVIFKPYGIMLNITPVIDKYDTISTLIEVENSVAKHHPTGTPEFTTSRVSTGINVKSGETVVLSGLLSDVGSKELRRIPGLGHLPILGELFKSRSFDNNETELVIFVTPRVSTPDSEFHGKTIEKAMQKYTDTKGSEGFKFLE